MTHITIDTAEVESVGGQFQSKAGELSDLATQARSLMSSLQSTFQGQRAARVFSTWDELQPNLQAAIDTLQAASDLLKQAATDFIQVDSA